MNGNHASLPFSLVGSPHLRHPAAAVRHVVIRHRQQSLPELLVSYEDTAERRHRQRQLQLETALGRWHQDQRFLLRCDAQR